MKKILILGGDGYLGWPTAMHFANHGYQVMIVDALLKRQWEERMGVRPLFPIPVLRRRVECWNKTAKNPIQVKIADIAQNHLAVYELFKEFSPDAIIHYAEQPSAPFSMKDRNGAVTTFDNNVKGTLNVLFAMREFTPEAHLVKLGTMGEYGTPNIDIEEGWLEITHNGRKDRLPYPKLPGSFYHASKVADSVLLEFACRGWGISVTDLNQGVVYGIETPETKMHPDLLTSFHYDAVFGTALNRFVVQAAKNQPITVYGEGGQTRGFLNLIDTIQCVRLAIDNPAKSGEFRVFNQFTEMFSVMQLAQKVKDAAKGIGFDAQIEILPNPRVEKEAHFYNAKNSALKLLGLKPNLLSEEVLVNILQRALLAEDVDHAVLRPEIRWRK